MHSRTKAGFEDERREGRVRKRLGSLERTCFQVYLAIEASLTSHYVVPGALSSSRVTQGTNHEGRHLTSTGALVNTSSVGVPPAKHGRLVPNIPFSKRDHLTQDSQ
jgi:hypothetical protein